MAYLLGAAAVMESLQSDVRDVQSCVSDILSRTGPVQCTSWKFPDKAACDLDIEDLLDLYSYSDDEEERQVAHIALYELVIDRLVFLLHSMSSFTEGVLKNAKADTEWGHISGTSVGVIAKKYWSRLTQLQMVVKHTVQEKNAMSRKVSELEGDVKRLDLELKQSYSTQRPKTAGFGGLIPPNRAEMVAGLSLNPAQLKEFGLISKDEYNKSCQTSESAFTPCDSCSMVQKSFRQCGDIVVAICQQQQIPSCLQKFRPQVSHLDWLSGNDVTRWAAEQHKDLQRISKLTATIKPLKDELSQCQEKSEKLEKRVQNFDRDLKREKDDRTALHKQYETKIKELESQHRQTLELEQQQKDLLEKNKHELESLLEKRKNELEEKHELLKDMENTKLKLEEELSGNKVNTSEVARLRGEMTNLQGKLNDVASKMDMSTKDLQREQAKNKSVSKHTQSLQTKQEQLLIRIEVLDEENRDLKDQLSEMEEEKEKFEESLEENKRETTQLERKLKENKADLEHVLADKESLEQTITTLETTVQSLNDKLEEAKERERLIVEYPDINGPVNPDLSGTGDILLDMENQVKANIVRIQLLETQNDGLRNSIRKLESIQQQQPHDYYGEGEDDQRWAVNAQKGRPQPLWDPSSVQHHENNVKDNVPEYSYMENTYNQSNGNNKPGMFGAQSNLSAHHQQNNNYSEGIEDSSKSRMHSAVHNIEFDNLKNASKQKSSPQKDKPAFGHRPLSGKKKSDEFIVGHGVRPSSAKKDSSVSAKSRPSSGKLMAPVNANSISAYLQLKKAGKINLPQNTGTGDILLDMENQVKANIVRIQLLETQNDGLRNSIRKLESIQQQQPHNYYDEREDDQRWAVNVQRGRPQPLWDPSSVQHHENNVKDNVPEYSYMENTYNQSNANNKPGMFGTQSNRSAHHHQNNYSAGIEDSSKSRMHSTVHNIEFDKNALKQKTSPQKDRPAFGHRPLSGKKKTDEFIVGHGVRPSSAKKDSSVSAKSRPSSGKLMAPVNANSISAYLQLKKAGKINLPHSTGSRPATGKPTIPTADYESDSYVKKDNFMCQNCDKMYDRQRDLDIHMSYCTG